MPAETELNDEFGLGADNFEYKPFRDDVTEHPVRHLRIESDVDGEPLDGSPGTVLTTREAIVDHLDDRLEQIREGQVGAAFKQGERLSKEQETILGSLSRYVVPNHAVDTAPVDEYETVGEWASALKDRLDTVTLADTDEERILRETFREHLKYDTYTDWPVTEFLTTLEEFLTENIEASPEYQQTLVGESAVQARTVG